MHGGSHGKARSAAGYRKFRAAFLPAQRGIGRTMRRRRARARSARRTGQRRGLARFCRLHQTDGAGLIARGHDQIAALRDWRCSRLSEFGRAQPRGIPEQLHELREERRLSCLAALRHDQHRGRAAVHDSGPGRGSQAGRQLAGKIQDRHVHLVAKPGQRVAGDEAQENCWRYTVRGRSQQELREIFRGLRYRCGRHGRHEDIGFERRGPGGSHVLVHQEEVSRTHRGGCHLHPGIGVGHPWYRHGA